MHKSFDIDDGRGQYPVVVKARTSVGLREAIKRAATVERVTTGEFIRQALSERVEVVLRGGSQQLHDFHPPDRALHEGGHG